jgi:hypothetical protein
MAKRLEDIFEIEKLDVRRALFDLAQWLPGVDGGAGLERDRERRRVFNDLGGGTLNRFISARRLGSPQHYRDYFAFAEPAGALRDEEAQAFIDLAEGQPDDAVGMLETLASKARPQGGVMAEVLIDRLIAAAEHVPTAAVPGVFAAFSAVLDTIARVSPERDFGEVAAWRSARRAVQLLLKRVPQEDRQVCLRRLFEGPALGWLASLLRSEIFSHGLYGDKSEPESQRLLTAAEFEVVLRTMLKRFSETPPDKLMRAPNLMSLLYGWMQGGGADEARQWVEKQTSTDSGLLTFLSHARGWAANSNIGVYYPLRKNDLQNFLDYEEAVRRVRAIAASSTASEADRDLAAELLVAIDQGQPD